MTEYIHIDLFSGIGGFSEGLLRAGMKITKTYFSEIDKNPIAVYKYKFKDAEYVGPIEDVSGTQLRVRHPNAKFIVTGDITQIDLPDRRDSGLLRAVDLLKNIDGISLVNFDSRDIVRHKLVKDIVEAYKDISKP